MSRLRDIKKRIGSINKTKKVLNAMKIVAASRLRKAQREAVAAKRYTEEIHEIAKSVSYRLGSKAPKIWRRRYVNKLDVLAFVSSKGLCGDFNESLVRKYNTEVKVLENHGIAVTLFSIGEKSEAIFKNKCIYLGSSVQEKDVYIKTSNLLKERFLNGSSDGAVLVFNRLKSAAVQELVIWDLLPLHWRGSGSLRGNEYLYEPDRFLALDALADIAIKWSVGQALIESNAAELASRVLAMDSSDRNATTMVSDLKRHYNRARQALITNELMDIVKGA